MVSRLPTSISKDCPEDGEDPSKFAVALEILADKAFGDMGQNARTWIICNRFIANHTNSALQRHLDSVPPETPIRDIANRCRVWENHANTDARRVVKPMLERAQPVYAVSEPTLFSAVSGHTGISTAAYLFTHEPRNYAETPASGRTATGTAASPCIHGVGSHVETPVSQNTDTGAATPSGDSPQGLGCGIVLLLWQLQPRGKLMPDVGRKMS